MIDRISTLQQPLFILPAVVYPRKLLLLRSQVSFGCRHVQNVVDLCLLVSIGDLASTPLSESGFIIEEELDVFGAWAVVLASQVL